MFNVWEAIFAVLVLSFLLLAGFVVIKFFRRNDKDFILQTLQTQQQDMGKLQGVIQQLLSEQGQSRHHMEQRLDGVTSRLSEQAQNSQSTLFSMREALSRLEVEQQKMVEMGGGLKDDVLSLRDILSNRTTRGAYGEIRLYDMVKSVLPANMVEEQKTLSNGKKVDCLIRLPEPTGSIPVDAKFPLENFQKVLGAETKEDRKMFLKDFGRDVKGHVNSIAEKYLLPGETADIALMFIPSEAVYGDIHAYLEDVVDYAWSKRVFMVSPTTMMAVLASVRAIMRHATSHAQALKIQKQVGLLKKDMGLIAERIDKLNTHFRQMHDDVDKITISKDKIYRHSEQIEALELASLVEAAPEDTSKLSQ